MARKLSETVQLKLRFSEELRRKLEKAAERGGQSMNAEIIARLEGSFARQETHQEIERAVESSAKLAAAATIGEIVKLIGQRDPKAMIAALLNHQEPAAAIREFLDLPRDKKDGET
jgi:glutamine phosphoribosylpyrophosphate amidotransferase